MHDSARRRAMESFFLIRIFRFQSIVDACGSARLHTRLFRDCGSNAETDANEPVLGAVRSAASVVSLFVQLALFLALPPLLCGKVGFAPIAAVAVYWICILREKKQLGGMNGDISGFSLTLAELAGIAALLLFDRM